MNVTSFMSVESAAIIAGSWLKMRRRRDRPKSQIRNLLKITRPESFHYLVDKTICLFKGITQGAFHRLDEDRKDELRQVHDPLGTSRDENASTLKQLEASREEMRVSYFEKLSEHLVGR